MSELVRKPELQGLSIVALGSFNPAIFQPLWFSRNKLIRDEEAEAAEIQIIHRELSIFSTEWFSLQVTDDRFNVDTPDPTKCQALRDLVLGTFKILEHTPVTAFGINRSQHFRMDSQDDWHAFGHYYAPKTSWKELLIDPGMRVLTIVGKRESCDAKQVQVRLEPSIKVHPGVYIHVNHHFSLDDTDASAKDRILNFLMTMQKCWDEVLTYTDRVSRHLLTEYTKSTD